MKPAPQNLFEIVELWRNNLPRSSSTEDFYNFEANLPMNSHKSERTLSVQLGYTIWEGKLSTMVIINDISTIKSYYKELVEHKDKLLATVSHELRTPLNGILGMLEMSIDETKEVETKKRLEICQISSKLLLNMINDILDFSLISKGKLVLNIDKIDLIQLMLEILNIFELQAQMKGITLVLEHKLENWCVKTDKNRLKQVLSNLIGNAIKYTKEGTIYIRVNETATTFINEEFSMKNDDSAGNDPQSSKIESDCDLLNVLEGEKLNAFHFEVEDSGVGIENEQIHSLFGLFGRNDRTPQHQSVVSLGLAISQSLVKRLTSDITKSEGIRVESEPGKGSKFFFRLNLPCRKSDSSNDNLFYHKINELEVQPSSFFKLNFFPIIERTPVVSTRDLEVRKTKLKALAIDDDQINLIVIRITSRPKTQRIEFLS